MSETDVFVYEKASSVFLSPGGRLGQVQDRIRIQQSQQATLASVPRQSHQSRNTHHVRVPGDAIKRVLEYALGLCIDTVDLSLQCSDQLLVCNWRAA